MLSLGASRTGLPFHIHGETWLALIHGRKRWFVYPPGAYPPKSEYKKAMIILATTIEPTTIQNI